MKAIGRRLSASALVRNALSLMVSTIGSAALGLAFWVLAAHLFSQRDVGRASAEVAAISLLSSVGQISVVGMIARFLPVARRRTGLILRRGYGAVLTITCILSFGFVTLGFGKHFLGRGVLPIAIFVITVLVFGIFALQDVVLTALRRAPWVLAENIAVAAARLALLPAVLVIGRHTGVIGAWAAPMVVAVAVVNWLVFGKLVPVKERMGDDRGLLPTRKELMSYGTAQFLSGVIGNIATMLPPVLVAARLGAAASAVFYFPWLFCTATMALLWNIVFSLVVEAVHDMERTQHMLKRAALMVALVTCGGAVILGFGASLILGVVGPEYRDSGTVILQLIALSLPFVGVGSLYGALSLIDRRTWPTTILDAFGTLIFIGGGIWIMPRYGVSAFGLTFLISQTTVALLAVPGIVLRYQRLSVPDPTVVLNLDRDAEMMAAETQILYPLFVARHWHTTPTNETPRVDDLADATTEVRLGAAHAAVDSADAPTEIRLPEAALAGPSAQRSDAEKTVIIDMSQADAPTEIISVVRDPASDDDEPVPAVHGTARHAAVTSAPADPPDGTA